MAVRVELADGSRRYFVTWGRIQDAVRPEALESLVLAYSASCSLGSPAVSARLCPSLREAAESFEAPYFYEGLLTFAHRSGELAPDRWRADRDAAMRAGREIYYCGRPSAPPSGRPDSADG